MTSITLLVACNSIEKDAVPSNVRELMESEGWMFCRTVSTDVYFESIEDPWIFEDSGTYDLFKRDNNGISEYAITRPNTDDISLESYDRTSDADHFKAKYWINYFVEEGDYNLRADHGRRNSGRLGVISKHYTGKAIDGRQKGVIYLNIPTSAQSQGNRIHKREEVIESEIIETPDEQPQKYKQCPICYSSGRCGACGGSGSVYNSIDYNPGQLVDCSACGGNGNCPLCGGSGMVEDYGW